MLSHIDFDKVLRPYGMRLKQGVILSLLQNHWSTVVGLQESKRIYPQVIIGNKIIIIAESTTALAYYRTKASDILHDINTYLAGSFVLVDIQFRTGKIQLNISNNVSVKKKERIYIDEGLEGLERIRVLVEYRRMQKMKRERAGN